MMNIPKHWENIELSKIVIFEKGKKPLILKTSQFKDSVPYLDINAIEYYNYKQFADKNSSLLSSENNILMVVDGSRSGWVGKGLIGAVGSTILMLSPITINSNFLYYFLKTKFNFFNENTTGVGIPHIDKDLLYNLQIPLPPLKAQAQIAETLEKELTFLKEKKDKLRIEFDIKKDFYKEQRLNELFLSLQIYPKTTIGENLEFIGSGVTPTGGKSNYIQSGIPFIRSQNVLTNKLDLTDVVFISEKLHNKMSRTHLKPKDILLNITGASIGRATILPDDFKQGNVNQNICIIRTKKELFSKYLSYYINSHFGQIQLLNKNSGFKGLNYSIIKSIEFYLPPFEKQIEIVNEIEKNNEISNNTNIEFYNVINKLETEEQLYEKAFSGKLCKPIENDIPVCELLEKIKEEKLLLELQKKELQKTKSKMKTQIEEKLDIVEILKQNKEPMLAVDVWKNSKYHESIDDFYKVLREEIFVKKTIINSKQDKTYLELA